MHLDLLCVADAATVDASGKLNILGAYDVMLAPSIPSLSRVVAAFRLVGAPGDAGIHDLVVTLVDADGFALAKTPRRWSASRPGRNNRVDSRWPLS